MDSKIAKSECASIFNQADMSFHCCKICVCARARFSADMRACVHHHGQIPCVSGSPFLCVRDSVCA